ncbi:MAG: MATE family efflux transporter [Cardiobacteriaceae bacterium]|nr:MATE family efflux transporter [Cardiobacteriaceae bacterium]
MTQTQPKLSKLSSTSAIRTGQNIGHFVTGSIAHHVWKMSLTGAIGLVAVFLADLLDVLFLAQLGNAAMVAGVGFAANVLFFVRSAGIAVSIAVGILVSRQLGAGRIEWAKRFATHGSVFAFVSVCGLSWLMWYCRDGILALLNVSAEVMPYTEAYLAWLLPSAPLLTLGFCGGHVLRAHGAASISMQVSVAAAVVNALLTPLMIFGFGWGLHGAALATVCSQVTLMLLSWWTVQKRFAMLISIRIKRLAEDTVRVVYYAFPALLSNWIAPIGGAFAARQMASFGDEAMAGYTVVMRFAPLSMAIILALSGAIAPIIGQNVGAKRFERVEETLKSALWFNWAVAFVVTGLLYVSREPLVGVFGLSGIAAELLLFFCSGVTLLIGFDGMQFCAIAAFNNLGKPFYSTLANLGRLFLGTIPFVLLCKALLGAKGVLLGYFLECSLVGVVCFWWVQQLAKRQLSQHQENKHV